MSGSAMYAHTVPFFDLAIKNEAEDKEKAALSAYNSLKEGKLLLSCNKISIHVEWKMCIAFGFKSYKKMSTYYIEEIIFNH